MSLPTPMPASAAAAAMPTVWAGCDLDTGLGMLTDDAHNGRRVRVAEAGGDQPALDRLLLPAPVAVEAGLLLGEPGRSLVIGRLHVEKGARPHRHGRGHRAGPPGQQLRRWSWVRKRRRRRSRQCHLPCRTRWSRPRRRKSGGSGGTASGADPPGRRA